MCALISETEEYHAHNISLANMVRKSAKLKTEGKTLNEIHCCEHQRNFDHTLKQL